MANIDAEKSVLGSALLSAEAYTRATTELTVEDFTATEHQIIFATMKRMYAEGKALDSITLMDALGHELNMAGGAMYITADLPLFVPSAANVEYYIGIVREESRKRHLMNDLERVITGIQSGDNDVNYIEQTEAALQNAHHRTKGKVQMIGDMAYAAYAEIVEGKKHGISTGFVILDQITGGLKKGHVSVIAGRPSMGKTSFATNIAANMAGEGKAVAFFSLEQPSIDVIKRVLIAISGCSEYDAQAQNQTQLERLCGVLDDVNKWRLSVTDDAFTLDKIKEQCYAVKRQAKGLDLVVIDYLQLIKTRQRKNGTREQEVSELSRNIKLLARELDCPVLLLSQLSRDVDKRTEHKPVLADLRESGAIEQDADEVIFLYRPWVYDKGKDPKEAAIIVAKNRDGDTGEIDAQWDGEHFKYTDTVFEEVPLPEEIKMKWEDL